MQLQNGRIDWARRCFVSTSGESVTLSPRECAVLQKLAECGGDAVSRDALLDRIWGRSSHPNSRAVDVTIARIRKKIEQDPRNPRQLKTAHGDGYRLLPRTPSPNHAGLASPQRLRTGEVEFEPARGTVTAADGRALELTELERRILTTLVRAEGATVTPSDFAEHAWGCKHVDPRTMARAIHRLRRKLEVLGDTGLKVVTVRRGGFRLDGFQPDPAPSSELLDPLWAAAHHVGKQLGCEDCVIYALDERHNTLVQVAAYGIKNPQEREIRDPITIPVGNGIVGSAVVERSPMLVHDVLDDPRYIPDQFSGRSELAVPIVFRNRVLGVLDSESSRVAGYEGETVESFRSLSTMLAPSAAQLVTRLFA